MAFRLFARRERQSATRTGEPRLAALGSWAVLAASFTLSAATWIVIGRAAGFDGGNYTQATSPTRPLSDAGLSWALPVAVDGYLVVALVLWMSPVPERVARFARANTYAAAGVGIVAQSAFHALTVHQAAPAEAWRSWLAGAVGALPPALAALAVHMRALIVREARPHTSVTGAETSAAGTARTRSRQLGCPPGTPAVPAARDRVPETDHGVPGGLVAVPARTDTPVPAGDHAVPAGTHAVPQTRRGVPAVPEQAPPVGGRLDPDRAAVTVEVPRRVPGTPPAAPGTPTAAPAPGRLARGVPDVPEASAAVPENDRVDVEDPWREFERTAAGPVDDPWEGTRLTTAAGAGDGVSEQATSDEAERQEPAGALETAPIEVLRAGLNDAEILADMRASGPYSIRAARTRYGIGQERASRLITEAATADTSPSTPAVPGARPAEDGAVPGVPENDHAVLDGDRTVPEVVPAVPGSARGVPANDHGVPEPVPAPPRAVPEPTRGVHPHVPAVYPVSINGRPVPGTDGPTRP